MPQLKVLLVDDEPDFLEFMSKRLTRRGLEVATAGNGEDALKKVHSGTFDVVVLDVKMPGMGGLECLRRIKEHNPDIQAVMLTGHADLSDSSQGFALGVFEYLIKPVLLDDLLEAIVNACSCSRVGRGGGKCNLPE